MGAHFGMCFVEMEKLVTIESGIWRGVSESAKSWDLENCFADVSEVWVLVDDLADEGYLFYSTLDMMASLGDDFVCGEVFF